MQSDKTPFLLALIKGDDLFEAILSQAKEAGWKNASIHGIGALTQVELAYYELETQTYHTKLFPHIYELISLHGNITLVDQQPFLHLHAAIADEQYQVFGGHLMKARVAVAAEILIHPLESEHHRAFHPEIGLKLIQGCGLQAPKI